MSGRVLYETTGRLQTPVASAGPARGTRLGRLRTIRGAAIVVDGDSIVDVGPRADVRRRNRGVDRFDLGKALVLPGFVDAHNHLPFAGDRAFELDLKISGSSYLDILAKGGGIHRTVRETRRASRTELARLCVERLDLMLRSGTTTTEAKSGYGLRLKDEAKQLEAVREAARRRDLNVVPTFLGAHVVPRGRAKTSYVHEVIDDMIPDVARRGLARFCDVFVERNAFGKAEARRILEAAGRHGLLAKLHADEFSNRETAALAARLGCTSADHLMHVSPEGIRALAGSETLAVLLPFVHRASFEARTAPARSLIEAGAAVALGTDFNPNCHNLSMLDAIRAAVYDLGLRPAEALTAATFNAAHALGEGDHVGTLEKGKRADFLVVEARDIVDLVYRQGQNPIRAVVVGGHETRY